MVAEEFHDILMEAWSQEQQILLEKEIKVYVSLAPTHSHIVEWMGTRLKVCTCTQGNWRPPRILLVW